MPGRAAAGGEGYGRVRRRPHAQHDGVPLCELELTAGPQDSAEAQAALRVGQEHVGALAEVTRVRPPHAHLGVLPVCHAAGRETRQTGCFVLPCRSDGSTHPVRDTAWPVWGRRARSICSVACAM